jgi:FkbM family methyltransferase
MNPEDIPCYTEIVTLDTYRLQSLDFVPDVIFDIGANLGVFANFARELFSDAKIVAIEPHPENFTALQANVPPDNVILLNKALGSGQVWRYPDSLGLDDSETTTAETYISQEFGFEIPDIENHPLHAVATEGVMLDTLYADYVQPGQQVLVKIDCEGAEHILFVHQPSIDVMRQADFLTMELHPYWISRTLYKWVDGQKHDDADALGEKVQGVLADTHDCISEPPMFYARKKEPT